MNREKICSIDARYCYRLPKNTDGLYIHVYHIKRIVDKYKKSAKSKEPSDLYDSFVAELLEVVNRRMIKIDDEKL